MSPAAAPLAQVLAVDAAQMARLLAAGAGDRALRQAARGALVRAFDLLSPASADDAEGEEAANEESAGEEAAPGPTERGVVAHSEATNEAKAAEVTAVGAADLQRLLALVAECERLLRLLEGPFAGVRPLRRVQVRRPIAERLRPPRVASRLQAQANTLVARCTPQLALSEVRLDWFEARTKVEAPGMIRPVRAGEGTREPAAGVEFELLRKKGRSPFS